MTKKYALMHNGKLTLGGVFDKYQDQIETLYREGGWADSTASHYRGQLQRIIACIEKHDEKSLGDYSSLEMEEVLEKVYQSAKQGKVVQAEETKQQYRRLIRSIIQVAFQNAEIDFSDLIYFFGKEENEKEVNYRKLIEPTGNLFVPKSLLADQEYTLAKLLEKECVHCGEAVAILLQYATGVRCNEACGANFGDIIKMVNSTGEEMNCLRVLYTTKRNSNSQKMGGKNKYSYRLLPLPESVHRFLMYLEEMRLKVLSNEDSLASEKIKQYPICCKGSRYTVRACTSDVSRAAVRLFVQIGIREDELALLSASLKREEKVYCDLSADQEFAMVEKQPTAYILRRLYASHLYWLGLPDVVIEYLMGHVSYDFQVSKRDFANPDLLYKVKRILEQRPLLNPIKTATYVSNKECVMAYPVVNACRMIVPANCGASIYVRSIYPGDELSVQGDVKGHIRRCMGVLDESEEIQYSILGPYKKRFQEIAGDYVFGNSVFEQQRIGDKNE